MYNYNFIWNLVKFSFIIMKYLFTVIKYYSLFYNGYLEVLIFSTVYFLKKHFLCIC